MSPGDSTQDRLARQAQATQSALRGDTQSSLRSSMQATQSALRGATQSNLRSAMQGTFDALRGRNSQAMLPAAAVVKLPDLTLRIPGDQFDRSIDTLQSPPPGGVGELTHPFQLIEVDTENVKVRFGQVQSITPTDVDTNIDVSGTNGTWTIYLECTLNVAGEITAVSVESATTGLPADDDDSAFITIGTVTVSGSVITAVNQALTHSLRFRTCDRTDDGMAVTAAGTYHFWGV